ncbi:MAG: hypothetical protein NTX25_00260 [Proteobacteria bacterium]|nr:hypothetical protein [Pseudomonadota bacterium]
MNSYPLIFALCMPFFGCGQAKSKQNPSRAETHRTISHEALPHKAEACQMKTQAKLLSEGIRRDAQNQILRYELAILNCKDGTAIDLNNLSVQFDLDAHFSDLEKALSYTIQDENGLEISGSSLNPVYGSDLFANTGNYAYWTTQNFHYPSKLEKITLELQLLDLEVRPYDSTAKSIDSYLKIGEALRVTQPIKILD